MENLIGKGIGGAVMAMGIDAWSLSGAVLLQFSFAMLTWTEGSLSLRREVPLTGRVPAQLHYRR